ncbi:MAG: DUF547 domain-containing protein [Spirochaetaceae bacterium]|nr:MAG: DUF547 domain-containing protein [Spirochaetaceae bacterium]
MRKNTAVLTVTALGLLLYSRTLTAAPNANLWPRWQTHDPAGTTAVDHSAWDRFLDRYLVDDHPSGINRVRYGEVSAADRRLLESYLDSLQGVQVSRLNRDEQKAYWINLYNAATVKVILDHYPVSSITKIDLSSGLFSRGPWDAEILTIEGAEVSLNDVEHRILRPIWQDPRVHYALNCASIGCPNLQDRVYTAANVEELLETGAREYINHQRGVSFQGNRLVVSSIYDWFQEDFEGSEEGVLRHLRRYAAPELAGKLEDYSGRISYQYDWSLNE